MLLAVLALGAGLAVWQISGIVTGTLDQVLLKTRLFGLNARKAEAAAVLEHIGTSWLTLFFGDGWGALIASPRGAVLAGPDVPLPDPQGAGRVAPDAADAEADMLRARASAGGHAETVHGGFRRNMHSPCLVG